MPGNINIVILNVKEGKKMNQTNYTRKKSIKRELPKREIIHDISIISNPREKFIKGLQNKFQISQLELSKEFGVTQPAISNFMRREKGISSKMLIALMDFCEKRGIRLNLSEIIQGETSGNVNCNKANRRSSHHKG